MPPYKLLIIIGSQVSDMSCAKFTAQLKRGLAFMSYAVLKMFYLCALSVCGLCCKMEMFSFGAPAATGVGAQAAAPPTKKDEATRDWQARVSQLPDDYKDDGFEYRSMWVDEKTAVEWRRASCPLWDAEKGPSHLDAIQGEVGTCYFVCALSALAESPARVTCLHAGSNVAGTAHAIMFFFRGQWTGVIVDTFFPWSAAANKPLCCKSIANTAGPTMWPALYEKAWVKLISSGSGDYAKAEGGLPYYALHCLTGLPSRNVAVSEHSRDELWLTLLAARGDSAIVCASIKSLPLFGTCSPSLGSWPSRCLQWILEIGPRVRLLVGVFRDSSRGLLLLMTSPLALLGIGDILSYLWHSCTTGMLLTIHVSMWRKAVVGSVLDASKFTLLAWIGCY
jgi:hypothetical protein